MCTALAEHYNLDHRRSYATRFGGAKPWGGVESNGKTLVSSADCKTGDEVNHTDTKNRKIRLKFLWL